MKVAFLLSLSIFYRFHRLNITGKGLAHIPILLHFIVLCMMN